MRRAADHPDGSLRRRMAPLAAVIAAALLREVLAQILSDGRATRRRDGVLTPAAEQFNARAIAHIAPIDCAAGVPQEGS